MVGSSIYTVTSVLTQREIDHHCAVFNILAELRLKIGMYTRFIEFANFQIPLLKFLLYILEYYQINLSQLFVIGAAKDSLSVDEDVDLPCVELLNENYTIIRKYLETFLCFVDLSHSFTKIDVHPTLLHNNDEGRRLSMYMYRVKIGERTLAENEVPLITKTEDRRKKRITFVSGSPPMKKAQTEGVVISDSWPSTAGKSLTALRRLIRQSGQAGTGSESATPATEDATSSFVTPTPEHASEGDFSDNAGVNVPVTKPTSDGCTLSFPELEAGAFSATPSSGSSTYGIVNSLFQNMVS
ncbi:hypothetical protein Tco_0614500 [Tanacetum coccineum]